MTHDRVARAHVHAPPAVFLFFSPGAIPLTRRTGLCLAEPLAPCCRRGGWNAGEWEHCLSLYNALPVGG